MRVSYQWLADYVDLSSLTPRAAAELLTMTGTKVQSVSLIDVSGILVGRVVTQRPHPGQTRTPLWVHQVDLGGGRVEQVIAGAPNAVAGSLVPVAPPGMTTPSGKFVRPGLEVLGESGWGMMCSEPELNLGDDGAGIMLLEEGEPGQDLATIFPLDAIIEAEVTSNRPDCLGHLGIARELAAASGGDLKWDFMPPFTGGAEPPGSELVEVVIEEPGLCSRYIAAVISGVTLAPSPRWMQRRLRAAGMRPISNVVDITNYVLLEYGQPLHTFDLAALEGPQIRVRRALPGEELLCLDGERRGLTPQTLVIADRSRPVALAGVIGGMDTSVREETHDVLLEAATFDGINVRATSRGLGLRTEASARFEKGLPSELALAGARRAAMLLQQVAGAKVHRDWADEYPVPQEPVRVRLWPAQVDSLLGLHVPLEESEGILKRLGFHVRIEQDGAWDVLPPVFRLDVTIPEDVVEEVGRIYGCERIPATLPGERKQTWAPLSPARPLERVQEVLLGAGFTEAVTPALTASRRLQALGLGGGMMLLANPLSDTTNALRTSLLPSLLEVGALNRNRGHSDVRLYETARVYLKQPQDAGAQPLEPLHLAALRRSEAEPRQGLLHLKAVLDRCAAEVGREPPRYERARAHLFHPGRCAEVWIGARKIGHLGEIHPTVLQEFGLQERFAAFEIEAGMFCEFGQQKPVQPVPRFPAAERDLAVVIEDLAPAGRLLDAIGRAGAPLLEKAAAFDEYRGQQLEPGLKSLTFALRFRSPERTLTDIEVEETLTRIRAALEREHGARFRT